MGDLFLAVTGSRSMEKLCVIKKVLPHLAAAENLQRFREEAMVVVRLSHGNIVSVFDAGLEQGELYLAMDFVDGKDLLATWNRCAALRRPFSLDIVAYIVKELARGLGYAHAFHDLKLVHRDVSPANLLLSYSGEVKLTDFGLAHSTLKVQETAPGVVYGKLSYLSPEQARGERLDGRSDLYSAGIILWELLTGQPLFPSVKLPTAAVSPVADRARQGPRQADDGRLGDTKPADKVDDSAILTMEKVRNPKILPPSKVQARVPPDLDRIALKALAVDPAERYQDGEELRADLAAYLAREAPHTDAHTLANFLRQIYGDVIVRERKERDGMLALARPLLATAHPPSKLDLAGNGGDTPLPRERPEADPRLGTTIAKRYLLRRLCGQGAMGRVYEGHHVEIGRRVAIKILHPKYAQSQEMVERFRREARAASRIGQANIVDVTDAGSTEDGAAFLVMEFLDGLTLEELLKRERALPAERALLIAVQVARALVAAHAADIIHRDLKPANIMLTRGKDGEDFVKVLDFGISRFTDLESGGRHGGITRPNAAMGTPIYMAPEQVAGRPADARADVYALAGVVYEMVSGEPPYEGGDALTVFKLKNERDPEPLAAKRPDLPRALTATVDRGLARLPEQRQPSMAAFKDALMAVLGDLQGSLRAERTPLPPRTLPPRTPVPTQRLGGRLPLKWALGGFGVLALAGASLSAIQHAATAPASAPVTPPVRAPGAVAAGVRPPYLTPHAAPSQGAGQAESAAVPAPGAKPAPALLAATPPAPGHPAEAASAQAAKSAARADMALDQGWPEPSPAVFPQTAKLGDTRLTHGKRAATTPAAGRRLAAGKRDGVRSVPGRNASRPSPESALLFASAQDAFAEGHLAETIRRAKAAANAGAGAEAHVLLGDAYVRLERYPDAVKAYDAALALDPENGPAARGRAVVLERQAHRAAQSAGE
jgi:serine/threonine protein kinase